MANKKNNDTSKMKKQELEIEKKTKGQPKSQAEKDLEQQISKMTGKQYKGKR